MEQLYSDGLKCFRCRYNERCSVMLTVKIRQNVWKNDKKVFFKGVLSGFFLNIVHTLSVTR